MKIAIPTKGNAVDNHFGHCALYTIFLVNPENAIKKIEISPSPVGCGCKSNIATTLKEIGVEIMLAGNMGTGALNTLQNQGIKVYRGCQGEVKLTVEQFIKGTITDSGETCEDHGHQCNH